MRSTFIDSPSQPIRNYAAQTMTANSITGLSQIGAAGQPGQGTADSTAGNRLFGAYSWSKARNSGAGTGALGLKGTTGTLDRPVQVGDVFRWGVWMKASTSLTITPYWENTDGTAYVGGSGGSAFTIGTTWTWVTGSLTVTVGHNSIGKTALGFGAYNGGVAEGITIWWNGLFVAVNQSLPPTYCDGDTPGWRWLGTSGLSQSTGYPYTLESIAGQPLDTNSTPGSLRPTIAIDPLAGRSLYVVYDVFDATLNTVPVAAFGSSSASNNSDFGALILRSGAASQNFMQARIRSFDDTSNQTVNTTTNAAIRSTGRHVGFAAINQGMTVGSMDIDAAFYASSVITPGNGLRNPGSLSLAAADTHTAPIMTWLFLGEHSTETRKRVTAWLARKYGSPIPSGY